VTILEALLLGLVQGVFMFVPVSSTSHLVLTQHLLLESGSQLPPPESPEMVLFDLVVHVGTLVSIVVVMRAGLRDLVVGVLDDWRGGLLRPARLRSSGLHGAVATRVIALMLLTTAVTGALGLLLRDHLTAAVFGTPAVVAVALLVTGGLLWWTDLMRETWRGPADVTLGIAVAVGVAQAAALTPGISRSGVTIFVALLLGLQRPMAARYSFYVAIPTILAASGVQALDVLGDGELGIGWAPMAVAFIVAAVVGAGALLLVLRLLEQAKFRIFAVYVVLLAGVVLVSGIGV
jgi:undecaprenyl-diphosphatase